MKKSWKFIIYTILFVSLYLIFEIFLDITIFPRNEDLVVIFAFILFLILRLLIVAIFIYLFYRNYIKG
ncbi:MAG: hypothetical protein BAJALOKI3v1_110041 [Promethearchaeota archaeon]|nr:MAG: hypothetical protein BAJALOKI3v1_110041 [Candidatus Lokiarchaeota archaeon]